MEDRLRRGYGLYGLLVGGAEIEGRRDLASAIDSLEARDEPEGIKLDVRRSTVFLVSGVFFVVFRAGLATRAPGGISPLGARIRIRSSFFVPGGLLATLIGAIHVGRLRRFGAGLLPRLPDEVLAGPGDEQDEQEQDDEGRQDPPGHVYAPSGPRASLH
jgi:hypothetical protein